MFDVLLRKQLQQVFRRRPPSARQAGVHLLNAAAVDVIDLEPLDRLLQHVPPHDAQGRLLKSHGESLPRGQPSSRRLRPSARADTIGT